jgi:hypothetical protein
MAFSLVPAMHTGTQIHCQMGNHWGSLLFLYFPIPLRTGAAWELVGHVACWGLLCHSTWYQCVHIHSLTSPLQDTCDTHLADVREAAMA